MLEGKCPKCGNRYFGWCLKEPRNQMCGTCGVSLEIKDDSGNTYTGYSPFTAEEYKIKIVKDKSTLESGFDADR